MLWTIALVALSGSARANPISCETPGNIVLADDGKHVVVSMLDMCDGEDSLSEYFIVQVNDGEWKTLDGKWIEAGTQDAEGGSGMETYTVYDYEVSCPGEGSYEFRLAFNYEGDVDGWFSETVPCEGRGMCSAVPLGTGLGALALSLGLVAARRRR